MNHCSTCFDYKQFLIKMYNSNMPTATQMSFNTGPQDAMLLDSGRSYFSNVGYVRTSNYAQEFKDIQPTNTAGFGTTVYWTIDRSADLLGSLDLMCDFDLKAATSTTGNWCVDGLGYAMIDKITFTVGTNDIQEIDGEWLYMENALMRDKDFKYDDLVLLDHDSVTDWRADDLIFRGRLATNGIWAADSESGVSFPFDNQTTTVVVGDLLYYEGQFLGIVTVTNDSSTLELDRDLTIAIAEDEHVYVKYRADIDGTTKTPKSLKRLNSTSSAKKMSVVVPLGLFFSKHPSQYLPLAAVAGCNDIKVAIKFRAQTDLFFTYDSANAQVDGSEESETHPLFGTSTSKPLVDGAANIKMTLRAQTYHLMAPEANALMSKEHVRLLTLQQKQANELITSAEIETATSTAKEKVIQLAFLHPVKELFVVLRWDADLLGSSGAAADSARNYWSYLGNPDRAANMEHKNAPYMEIESFELSLNGNKTHPMAVTRDYMMKRLIPQHHSRGYNESALKDGGNEEIYCIPFAMNPEGHNPSGHLNFSKVSHGRLHIKYLKPASSATWTGNVHVDVWANYYNWLQIRDGRAVLSFQ